VVVHVVPMDRKRIRFFGHPLARNEVIAAILTICTNRPWDRKQVSSHHQQLKSKQHIPADRKSCSPRHPMPTHHPHSVHPASSLFRLRPFTIHPQLDYYPSLIPNASHSNSIPSLMVPVPIMV